jgi:hypothetical protein
MGIANIRLNLSTPFTKTIDMDAKLFGMIFTNLPDGTKLVDIQRKLELETYEIVHITVSNPLFRNDSEITARFQRDCTRINEELVIVDSFQGLDLKGVLKQDKE